MQMISGNHDFFLERIRITSSILSLRRPPPGRRFQKIWKVAHCFNNRSLRYIILFLLSNGSIKPTQPSQVTSPITSIHHTFDHNYTQLLTHLIILLIDISLSNFHSIKSPHNLLFTQSIDGLLLTESSNHSLNS